MAEAVPFLEVHHVTCDVHRGEGGGIYAVLHLKQSDGALLPVALPLQELLYVAQEMKAQLCEVAGVQPADIDDARPAVQLNG